MYLDNNDNSHLRQKYNSINRNNFLRIHFMRAVFFVN